MESEVNGVLVAAHDLKAPLVLMRQLALSLDGVEDSCVRQRLQQQLVQVANRSLRQVNDLTRLARLEDGLFEMEPVSVRGLCDEVYSELSPLFYLEKRRLCLSYSNRARLAIANRDLLKSIIYNLCTNAVRYSDAGTASILTISDASGLVRIGVRDFGPALPSKIWQELRHGGLERPVATAMRPGSSGLGLYTASQFARHMQASLGAIRHRDGASIFVDLPVSHQASLFGG